MIPKKYIPVTIRALNRFRSQSDHFTRMEELDIVESGIDAGHAYIRLKNSYLLFGYPSDRVQKHIYKNFLNKGLRTKLHPESLNLAIDICKRYLPYRSIAEARAKSRFIDIRSGTTVIEGGAYTGLYAIRAGEQTGLEGKVLAIEAIEENFEILKRNVVENNLTHITPIHTAIWDKPEILTFYRSRKQNASFVKELISEASQYQVPANSIDNILEEHSIHKVDHVRLQINGAELAALRGMRNTLNHNPQIIIASRYTIDGKPMLESVAHFLKELGLEAKTTGWNTCVNLPENYFTAPGKYKYA